MGVGEDFDEGLLDGGPVLGFFGICHGNKCLDTLHSCMTHGRVLINNRLLQILNYPIILIPHRPKQRLIHYLLTSGQ